jgi:hypothetical protein
LTDEPLTGGCQCGAVRFRAAGLGNAGICHCRMCQKAFGNVYAPLVTVDDLTWTRGSPAHYRSSNIAIRGFCRDCGTPLTYEPEGAPPEVAIGAFDDPSRVAPTQQVGTEARVGWVVGVDELPAQPTSERDVHSLQHPDHDT